MKIVFYGLSPEIKQITQNLSGHEVHVFEDPEQVKGAIGKDEALLVLDVDFNKDCALALNQRYSSSKEVKRILISKNAEMENEEIHCTAGLFGEWDADKLKYIVEENAVSQDATIEKDIQDAFNMAFGEEESVETPAAEDKEPELELGVEDDSKAEVELEAKEESGLDLEMGAEELGIEEESSTEAEPEPSAPALDSYSVVDEESDLTFDLGAGMGEEVVEEITETAPEEKAEEVIEEMDAGALEDAIEANTKLELGGEISGGEESAPDSSGDLDLGEDLGVELELGGTEAPAQEEAIEDMGDLDLDLGEDITTADVSVEKEPAAELEAEPAAELEAEPTAELEAEPEVVEEVVAKAPAEEPEVPIEFTVEIPNMEEELASSTNTELAVKESTVEEPSAEDASVELEFNAHEGQEREEKEEEAPVQEKIQEERVVYQYDDNALVRLEATIRQLREEREEFLKEIEKFNLDKNTLEGDNLGLRAEVEELRVEVGLLKKRNIEEREDYKHDKKMLQDNLIFSEQKIKNLEDDNERLSQKARIDVSMIRQKERELEGQLELLTMDSENQINNREQKILELKRQIDALEFNMENVSGRDAKNREEKLKVEEKLNKVMKSMRSSIKFLEEELETEPEFLKEIKKEAA